MTELYGPGVYGVGREDSDGHDGITLMRSICKDPSKVLMLFVSLEKYSEGFFLVPITTRRAFFWPRKIPQNIFHPDFLCVSLCFLGPDGCCDLHGHQTRGVG